MEDDIVNDDRSRRNKARRRADAAVLRRASWNLARAVANRFGEDRMRRAGAPNYSCAKTPCPSLLAHSSQALPLVWRFITRHARKKRNARHRSVESIGALFRFHFSGRYSGP